MKRKCNVCKIEKELSTFGVDRGNPLGRMYRCRNCENARMRSNYRDSKKFQKRQLYLKSEKARKLRNARLRKDYLLNKQKYIAKRLAERHLGQKPCEKCGSTKTVIHHPDYSKPLDVVWLCQRHHSEEHMKMRLMPLQFSS